MEEVLEAACDEHEETYGCRGGLSLKTGVADAVGVGEDVHRDVEGGASLPV